MENYICSSHLQSKVPFHSTVLLWTIKPVWNWQYILPFLASQPLWVTRPRRLFLNALLFVEIFIFQGT